MTFAQGAHNVTVNHSSLYDIHGDYHGKATPGEKGIIELSKSACPEAFHDSQMRHPPPRCLPRTRESVLEDIANWISARDEPVMWLSGPAGAGKSAIAQTVSETCAVDKILLAAFFFFRGGVGRNSSERLIASIAYQVATYMPDKRTQLGTIVEKDLLVFQKSLAAQIQELLVPLFRPAYDDNSNPTEISKHRPSFIIIIDGLDECAGDNNQREIVNQLGSLVGTHGIPLRCLISSRPEPQIEESIRRLPWKVHHISLSDRARVIEAEENIRSYLYEGFKQISYKRYEALSRVKQPWPSDEVVDNFVRKSEGMFIYAATVLKYVHDDDYHPANRLEEIIHVPRGSKPFAELDLLYQHIISTCQNIPLLIQILTVRFLDVSTGSSDSYQKVAFYGREIEFLLDLQPGTVAMVLRRMHSLLCMESSSYITMHHASFQDFIHNKERAGEYTIDREDGHRFMAQALLRFIARTARSPIPEDLQRVFQYAWTCWPTHYIEAGSCSQNPNLVEEISETLSVCSLFQGDWNSPLRELSHGVGIALNWLDIDELQAREYVYNPLDTQYQLFKSCFYQELDESVQPPIQRFILYEGLSFLDASKLLGDTFFIFYKSSYRFFHLAYNQTTYIPRGVEHGLYNASSFTMLLDATLNRLMWRIIEEEGHTTMGNHGHIVGRCLTLINEGYSPAFGIPREHSYAQKYWTKHLQYVPPGNLDIVGAIQNLNVSKLSCALTQEERFLVNDWLRESELVVKAQGYHFFTFACL